MASRQEKEKRTKETAAYDLSDVNRDNERENHEERPGVIGSVMKAVQSAKEAVVGKTNDENDTRNEDVGFCAGDVGDQDRSRETTESDARTLDEKAREMKERTSENAKDAAEKVREAAERTKQMVESAKGMTKDTARSATDKTKEKAQEAKEKTLETSQSAADKTKDTAQSAAAKLGELKDKAMGLFSGKKEDKEWMHETTGAAKEKPREVQEEARRREKEMGMTDRDKYEGDVGGLVPNDKDEAPGVQKEKLTPHSSNRDKTRLSTDASRVSGRNEGEKNAQRTSEEQVMEVYLEDTPPSAIASALKASHQMTGRIDNEGVVRIVRRDRLGKM